MKKTYIEPRYKTIDLSSEQMMALSGNEDQGGVITGAKMGNAYNSQDASYVKESRGNLWDEEW